eukprot:Rhum_TRINITY_DN4633_c0_g1::Rhum_TRINITY_DN4633_c0_g1_i1::g.15141::m.15141
MYRFGDTVQIRRRNGTWQTGVVTRGDVSDVVVQWGTCKKSIPLPSPHIRPFPASDASPVSPRAPQQYAGGEVAMDPYVTAACEACGTQAVPLFPCSGCYDVVYCGDACQYKHWGHHRVRCAAYAERRSAKRQLERVSEQLDTAGVSPPLPPPPPPPPVRIEASEEVRRSVPRMGRGGAAAPAVLRRGQHVEAANYSGTRAHFNGLHGHVVDQAPAQGADAQFRYFVKFYLRGGVVLSMSDEFLRPASPMPDAFSLGARVAAGDPEGKVGVVVGSRGGLILCEFDGKHQGVFPVQQEDLYFLN